MRWSAYTFFSVLSGALLMLSAFMSGMKPSDRAWFFFGGAGLLGYGVYAGMQTHGTFTFPIWIFIIPLGALFYIGAKLVEGKKAPRDNETSDPNVMGDADD